MNEYVFYTIEGETTAPKKEVIVNNCQLLGFSRGRDKTSALNTLLKENTWIEEAGFSVSEIVGLQVLR